MVANRLARFAKVEYDASEYRGKYRPNRPRQVPTDETIVSYWESLGNPKWRWVIGMMATYGLRNHEVFRIDFDELADGEPIVHVLAGKTGSRLVFPFHPEWVDRFRLVDVLVPEIDLNRDNEALGHSVTEYVFDHDPLFAPYDLRHAYAVRTLSYGIDPSIAARYMGHSRKVHEQVYRKWIDRALLRQEYEKAINRSDRPRPPSC